MKLATRNTAAILSLLALSGCNWFDNDSGPAPIVDLAPDASIVFPTRTGFTPADSITVRGIASDDNAVASVTVNDVLATSTDQYATWTADVPLDYGTNTITVSVVDDNGTVSSNSDEVVVERRTEIRRPFGYELDTASNTLYYVDIDLFKLMTINLSNGDVAEFADLQQFAPTVPSGRPPLDIALDLDNDRVFLTVRSIDVAVAREASIGIWVYDTMAETWSAFSDASIDSAAVMTNPSDVFLDTANARLLVLEYDLDAVIAIDLSDGRQSVFSSNTVPSTAVSVFGEPIDAVLDAAGNRLLVVDRQTDRLFAVSLTDGSRTVISGGSIGSGDSLVQPLSVEYDIANNRALIFDRATRRLVQIDLATGARSQFAGNFDDSNGLFLLDARALAISGNDLIVLDNIYDHALAFDLTTAARRVISNNGFPRGTNDPGLYAIEKVGDAIFGHTYSAMGRIDADNTVSILAGDIDGGDGALDVIRLAVDATASTAYIVGDFFVNNVREYRVQSIDLATGAVTTLSDNAVPNATNPIQSARALVLSADGDTLYLLEDDRITLIDVATGDRTIMADNGSIPYVVPEEMELDNDNDRLLVADRDYDHLIAIDLTSGDRSVFANTALNGESGVERIDNLAVAENGAIYAVDILDRLVEIDPQDGERRLVLDIDSLGADYPRFWEYLTTGPDVIYARTYEGIVELDPQTGEMLLILGTPASAPGNAS